MGEKPLISLVSLFKKAMEAWEKPGRGEDVSLLAILANKQAKPATGFGLCDLITAPSAVVVLAGSYLIGLQMGRQIG